MHTFPSYTNLSIYRPWVDMSSLVSDFEVIEFNILRNIEGYENTG